MTEEKDSTALATQEPQVLPARRMTVQELAAERPQAIEAFVDAMASAAKNIRRAAFALTDPEDWVLNRDKEGNEVAMLGGPGCQKIAPLLGVAVTNLRGPTGAPASEPVYENGVATIIGDVHSRVLGTYLEAVRAERDEAEKFTGREGNKGDLKSAAMTLLLSKGVRMMLGLTRVPIAVLAGNGLDTARCRRGHGYGTSGQRQAGTAPAAPGQAGVPTVAFGKLAGTPITDLNERQLDWYINAARENLNNPDKSKYHAKERAWLQALNDELGRRRMGDAPDSAPEPGSEG